MRRLHVLVLFSIADNVKFEYYSYLLSELNQSGSLLKNSRKDLQKVFVVSFYSFKDWSLEVRHEHPIFL
jgi:hypothetical protein